jgi:hypothetical protein
MKVLSKLKLHKISVMNNHEMKKIMGGYYEGENDTFVECKYDSDSESCNTDTKGKKCKK